MPGITARIRAKLSRSNSAAPSLASSANSQHSASVRPASPASSRRPDTSSTGTGHANGDNVSNGITNSGELPAKQQAASTGSVRENGSDESKSDTVETHQPVVDGTKSTKHNDSDKTGTEHPNSEESENPTSKRSAQGETNKPQSQNNAAAAPMASAGSETAGAAAASTTAGNDLHPTSISTSNSTATTPSTIRNPITSGGSLLSTIREQPSDPKIPQLAQFGGLKQEQGQRLGEEDEAQSTPSPTSQPSRLATGTSTGVVTQGEDTQPRPTTPVRAPGQQQHRGPAAASSLAASAIAASIADDDNHLSPSPATPRPPTALDHPPVNNTFTTENPLSDSPRSASPAPLRPGGGPERRQSLFSNRQSTLLRALISNIDDLDLSSLPPELAAGHALPVSAAMVTRKIWVRRPGGSATLVTIGEEDVVDDVRDMILRKYANSLGRQFDAPDLTIRIAPREQRVERQLGPEEPMARTLDAYYPGGQSVEEALIIDVPLRRTPRPSPRAGPPHAPQVMSFYEDPRPAEMGTDYFGPAAIAAAALPVTITSPPTGASHPHSIAVLTTGQVPQLPSPGGTRSRAYRDRPDRPRLGRQHTSSPTILNIVPAGQMVTAGMVPSSAASSGSHKNDSAIPAPPTAPPLPSPPVAEATASQRTNTPPPRVSSPRTKKSKKKEDLPKLPAGSLSAMVQVPPINVLIVEDNIINLKLLEAFVKRLKVRWQTAMNGRDAVIKWRAGGFHLVLMDIQLPIMSGLEATKEIRRLERANSIGVFSSGASTAPNIADRTPEEGDKLPNIDMFKSPVIIVALTASSLQSDRHEALAAGCNDFLTKPVNFVWLERKVMEWGCMQALIDFDGWRTWKAITQQKKDGDDNDGGVGKKAATKAKKIKNRQSLTAAAA